MPLPVKALSIWAVQLPSRVPRLIDTTPGPMRLTSLRAATRLLIDGSGAWTSTSRASGAVAWAHCTSSAISVAQPDS